MMNGGTVNSATGVLPPQQQQHSLRKLAQGLRVGRIQPWLIPLLYALAAIAAGLTFLDTPLSFCRNLFQP